MNPIAGCGVGLRREFLFDALKPPFKPDWFEVAPENWIAMPALFQKAFDRIARDYPLVAHGLSLSVGSPEPTDRKFLKALKTFLDRYGIEHYSEHLSFSSLGGVQSYELLPLPMTRAVVDHVADKVARVQDALGRELILENATYYYVPHAEMTESDFINAVLDKSGAKLLLDVNNVYVNAFNHGFDAKAFIKSLNLSKVAYYHVAGHLEYKKDLWIDTHGMPTKDDVWKLLAFAHKLAPAPALLERDNNVPDKMADLLPEYKKMIRATQSAKGAK